jgi:hypothetical protein
MPARKATCLDRMLHRRNPEYKRELLMRRE